MMLGLNFDKRFNNAGLKLIIHAFKKDFLKSAILIAVLLKKGSNFAKQFFHFQNKTTICIKKFCSSMHSERASMLSKLGNVIYLSYIRMVSSLTVGIGMPDCMC